MFKTLFVVNLFLLFIYLLNVNANELNELDNKTSKPLNSLQLKVPVNVTLSAGESSNFLIVLKPKQQVNLYYMQYSKSILQFIYVNNVNPTNDNSNSFILYPKQQVVDERQIYCSSTFIHPHYNACYFNVKVTNGEAIGENSVLLQLIENKECPSCPTCNKNGGHGHRPDGYHRNRYKDSGCPDTLIWFVVGVGVMLIIACIVVMYWLIKYRKVLKELNWYRRNVVYATIVPPPVASFNNSVVGEGTNNNTTNN
ncbi:hypothetical protein ABK040_000960 [Willaertia magna]